MFTEAANPKICGQRAGDPGEPMVPVQVCRQDKVVAQRQSSWRSSLFLGWRVSTFESSRPSTDWVWPTTLGRAICLTESTASRVRLIHRPFQDTPKVTSAVQPGQHQINHHKSHPPYPLPGSIRNTIPVHFFFFLLHPADLQRGGPVSPTHFRLLPPLSSPPPFLSSHSPPQICDSSEHVTRLHKGPIPLFHLPLSAQGFTAFHS